MSDAKNQCMGCQAGWPLRHASHAVVGGYTHETVACTADRYVETELRARLAACERERDEAVRVKDRAIDHVMMTWDRKLGLVCIERNTAIAERDAAVRERDEAHRNSEAWMENGDVALRTIARLTEEVRALARERDAAIQRAALVEADTVARIVSMIRATVRDEFEDGCDAARWIEEIADDIEAGAWRGKEGA